MPDESCRHCGGLLLDYLICAKCRAPTQFICRICAHQTIPRYHDQFCFRPDEIDIKKPPVNEYNTLIFSGIPHTQNKNSISVNK